MPPSDLQKSALMSARPLTTIVKEHIDSAERVNAQAIDAVAAALLRTVQAHGLIYAAGTGHSLALVLELFYRAGGLACIRPVYHPALLPLAGARYSTHAENIPGMASLLLERLDLQPTDIAVVFSHSGLNAVPFELATGFRAHGIPVVAFASTIHVARARRHPSLLDVADHIIDTGVPYGDAVYPTADGQMSVPLSTVIAAFLWNVVLSRLVDAARDAAVALPIWTSSNISGGNDRNRHLMASYSPRVPEL